MGGGRDYFTLVNSTGKRSDEDLITKWKNDKQKRFAGKTAKYITNREELLNTDMSKVDFVLGKSSIIQIIPNYILEYDANDRVHVRRLQFL